jgi:hypothetical protein
MEEYREIELNETKLRVYRNGDILRLCKGNSKGCKKGDWRLIDNIPDKWGYNCINIRKKLIKSHRIVGYAYLGLDIDNTKLQIDHKNRIRNDNRVENLEIVTHQQNQFNKGAKGYCFHKKTGKYQARIYLNRKKIFLGCYDTEEEAATAYQNAKLVHHSF